MIADALRDRATQLICPFASAVVGRRMTTSAFGCLDFHSVAMFSISVFTEANEKSGFGLISAFSVIGISFVGHAPYTMADERRTIFLIPTADAASNTRRVASISAPPASIPSLLGPNDVARWMSEFAPSKTGFKSSVWRSSWWW